VGLIADYFSWRRIVRPTLLFVSSITVVSFVSYRVGLRPVHPLEAWFYGAAALAAMIAYKLTGRARSSLIAILCGAATVISGFIYVISMAAFVGESFLKTLFLFLLFVATFAFLYSSLAILRNRGYT
jgi:4-amino-4-deoxy-L-arabinose transferase-like glycosyltransferase